MFAISTDIVAQRPKYCNTLQRFAHNFAFLQIVMPKLQRFKNRQNAYRHKMSVTLANKRFLHYNINKKNADNSEATMQLRVYNTLTRKKELFQSIKPNQVGIYSCGPTVYKYPHIGNFRAYAFMDAVRRVLEYDG